MARGFTGLTGVSGGGIGWMPITLPGITYGWVLAIGRSHGGFGIGGNPPGGTDVGFGCGIGKGLVKRRVSSSFPVCGC